MVLWRPVVLLKVAGARCRLREAIPDVWARRVHACAVRGGTDGAVLGVTLSTSRAVYYMGPIVAVYMTV